MRYTSDIIREQFEKARPIFESARKRTKPRTVDLYGVFCGLLYVLKSGCQWRMLPMDAVTKPTWMVSRRLLENHPVPKFDVRPE